MKLVGQFNNVVSSVNMEPDRVKVCERNPSNLTAVALTPFSNFSFNQIF